MPVAAPQLGDTNPTPAALERHFTVSAVAELWGLSQTKVREIFRDEPGVLQTQLRTLLRRNIRRQNVALRVDQFLDMLAHVCGLPDRRGKKPS